ncbi:hypothetical protein NR798_02115 [Archangium gephyra]|uniref:SitA5 family polymorphic toxin n=1 Tax=Archangium gephyra TaxID=48 RepID=UPI0035D4772F
MAHRLTVMVTLLSLLSACTTARGVRLDIGEGPPREYRLPTSNKSVKVEADAFEEALTLLVQGGWARASCSIDDTETRWRSLMSRSFGGLCRAGQHRADCLSLRDGLAGLTEWDKLGVSLGLSLQPMRESIARAVEKTLAPQLFYTVIATGLITWAVLAANPEPVFTKAAAIVSVLMLVYLGMETFLEVVEASRELKRASDKAITPGELERAGQRFAERVGPQVARVVVLAVTMVVSQGMTGGAAWLASRLSGLPGFPEAAAVGASQLGINLANVGQVRAVAVVGGTIVITLPSTAVAMVGQGSGEGAEAPRPSGQLHHPISKRIARKLDLHRTLKGRYTERDPRFVTRAADKAAHNGYQKWHRDVDDEVINWLERYSKATPEEFEAMLRGIYNRPDMRARFPDGL